MRHWGQLHETGGHCVRHWPSWPAPPYWAAYHLPCWSGRGGQVEDVAFLSSLKGNPKSSDVCQLGWWVTRDQHRFHLLLHVIEVDGSCGPSHPWRFSFSALILLRIHRRQFWPASGSLSAFIFFPPFGDRLWNSRREDPWPTVIVVHPHAPSPETCTCTLSNWRDHKWEEFQRPERERACAPVHTRPIV